MVKKVFLVILALVVVAAAAVFSEWRRSGAVRIADDLYRVGESCIYQLNPSKVRFGKLYCNRDYRMIEGKVLKVNNIPAVFEPVVEGEKNVVTAWVARDDETKVLVAETNSRLGKTKVYPVTLNLGKDLKLLDPVYELKPARGGGNGEFGLGCQYGDYEACVWVIPKVEPLKGPQDYAVAGIPVRYTDTIAFPVVERFGGVVEYKHMYETLRTDQPNLEL